MPETIQAAAKKPRPGWVLRIWGSADDAETWKKWLTQAGLVVLGALMTQLLGISGCNTTPNQMRVNDLITRVATLETDQKTMDERFKPRKELDGDDLLRSRSYDQMNKRLDHVDQVDDELVQLLVKQAH